MLEIVRCLSIRKSLSKIFSWIYSFFSFLKRLYLNRMNGDCESRSKNIRKLLHTETTTTYSNINEKNIHDKWWNWQNFLHHTLLRHHHTTAYQLTVNAVTWDFEQQAVLSNQMLHHLYYHTYHIHCAHCMLKFINCSNILT